MDETVFRPISTIRGVINFSKIGFQAQVDLQPVNWNPPP